MTTLTEFIHDPALGILRMRLGNRARMKNGDAKATEKAKTDKNCRKSCSAEAVDADTLMNPP